MKSFLSHNKKLHLWLLANLILLAAFFALRNFRAVMDFYTLSVADPLVALLRCVTALVPFSVAEALCVLLVLDVLAFLVFAVVYTLRAEKKRAAVYSLTLTLLCSALTVYTAFCWLWGVYYYTDRFYEQSALTAEKISVDELYAVTERFAEKLIAADASVPRDENGRVDVSREDILDAANGIYASLYREFPFLEQGNEPIKPIYFSRAMSYIGFTGFYCPFTGESNVNMDSPIASLPTTCVHELSHRRGVATEQECNFLGIRAAAESEDAVYRYSGCLTGYIHLSNALYGVDREKWQTLYDTLPDTVISDFRFSNAYWAQFEGPARKTSDAVYDGFLKSYGNELGLRSYGACVDLLVAYYK